MLVPAPNTKRRACLKNGRSCGRFASEIHKYLHLFVDFDKYKFKVISISLESQLAREDVPECLACHGALKEPFVRCCSCVTKVEICLEVSSSKCSDCFVGRRLLAIKWPGQWPRYHYPLHVVSSC